jgi:hypothetical protein
MHEAEAAEDTRELGLLHHPRRLVSAAPTHLALPLFGPAFTLSRHLKREHVYVARDRSTVAQALAVLERSD